MKNTFCATLNLFRMGKILPSNLTHDKWHFSRLRTWNNYYCTILSKTVSYLRKNQQVHLATRNVLCVWGGLGGLFVSELTRAVLHKWSYLSLLWFFWRWKPSHDPSHLLNSSLSIHKSSEYFWLSSPEEISQIKDYRTDAIWWQCNSPIPIPSNNGMKPQCD